MSESTSGPRAARPVQPWGRRSSGSSLATGTNSGLAFMERFPRHIELPEAILIHGMFEPGIPLEQQKDTVVIGTLTAPALTPAPGPRRLS